MERIENFPSPRPEDIEAKRIAQERIGRIEKSRSGLGCIVLGSLGIALRGIAEKGTFVFGKEKEGEGKIAGMIDFSKKGALEVMRRSSLKMEDDYNGLVRQYEDRIELASGDEKSQLQREFKAIKSKWLQTKERGEQDHSLLLKYLGLT